MNKLRAAIKGLGAYVPDYVLTNAELEKMVETNDSWIVERTGIKERRILKGENMGSSHLGVEAIKSLLAKTDTDPKEIELIICSTTTPDFVFPATANIIASEVGAINSFSFDMQAACSGFLYALETANQYITSGKYKKIIVVGADKMSSIVDYTDRANCIIFGDGAGAVLIEPSTDETGIIDTELKSDGSGWHHLYQKAGGSRRPPSLETVENKEHYIYQEGPVVFKNAVNKMAEVSTIIMKRNNLTSQDVTWLCPHQANLRIISATANAMKLEMNKVMVTIHKYGNTTNATIPLTLADYEPQLKKGDNIIFASFGGGFTWGSIYTKWSYNGNQ